MDKNAEHELTVTAQRLRAISADLGAAHESAGRAASSGGPDYRNRIKDIIAECDALAGSIADCAEAGQSLHGRAGYGG